MRPLPILPRYAPLLNWIAFACMFCLALLAYRIHWSGRTSFFFLSWNLALAAIPLMLALAALGLARICWTFSSLALLMPWLLFLPNAPYILTHLLHLKARAPIPLWYDLILLLSFALTGLLLGFLSMMCVERVLLRVFTRPVVLAIHGACSFCAASGSTSVFSFAGIPGRSLRGRMRCSMISATAFFTRSRTRKRGSLPHS